jgi:uncharacterized membrane protein YfcA
MTRVAAVNKRIDRASAWIGHRAHIATVLLYCAGAAMAGLGGVYTHHWASAGVRHLAPWCFVLYTFTTIWLHAVRSFHRNQPCEECDDDELRFLGWHRTWHLVEWRFRQFHKVTDYQTWLTFQIAAVVTVSVAENGFAWVWLAAVPLAAILAVVYVSVSFHTRFGFRCPVCLAKRQGGPR